MRKDRVKAEHKRPEAPKTWQPTSDRRSAEREPNPTDENGSPTMSPERLGTSGITAPPESETRSPDKNVTSLYEVLRLHFNRLLQSTKRSLIVTRQSTQQKLAARAASRKAKQKARDLAKLRSALLISFPSKQEEQARLKAEEETTRKAEEAHRHEEEAQARIKAEEERQADQARLKAEEETKRKAEEAHRHEEEAQARIRAEQERQAEQALFKAEEQARLKAAEERIRKAEESRSHEEAQAAIRAEQERQLTQAEQTGLKAQEESLKDSENKHCP